jgi:hypothetical protein
MNKLVAPYDEKTGNPNSIFSETTKLGQPETNRAKQISVKGDTDKDFYVGIKDIDEALMYYFTDILKLSTIQSQCSQPPPTKVKIDCVDWLVDCSPYHRIADIYPSNYQPQNRQ